MKLLQSGNVTFCGLVKEKTQRIRSASATLRRSPSATLRRSPSATLRRSPSAKQTFEAFFVCVFLLCLFLTGCSGSLNGGPDSQGAKQFLQASGEANMPPKSDVLSGQSSTGRAADVPSVPGASQQASPAPALNSVPAEDSQTERAMKSLIAQDVVQDRVRKVLGWLRFQKQEKTAEILVEGWARVSSGQLILPLNNSGISGQPDLSTTELMLWRQLLKNPNTLPAEETTNLETMALLLTTAKVPEDLFRADKLLVVSDELSRY